MMWLGHGFGFGLGMMVLMLVFWGAIIGVIIWGIRRFSRRYSIARSGAPGALDIVKERYARGEISKDQFDQFKKDLS
jgi:putative membrane protein